MNKALLAGVSLAYSALVSGVAWAAEDPIAAMKVEGQATITAGDTSFTLTNQEYAYFSGDLVETAVNGEALVSTNQGLNVALDESSVVSITREDGVYTIDLSKGSMGIDAKQGVEYRLTQDGEPVSGGERFIAGDEPYVAKVVGNEDVKFYMPAQLAEEEDDDDRRGLFWLFLGGAAAIILSRDDAEPSS